MKKVLKLKNIKLINFKKFILNEKLNEIHIINGIITNNFESKQINDQSLVIDCTNCIVSPGFIDPQINGLDDCNFWETPSFNTIDKLRLKLAHCGVTGFCPTIITSSKENILKSIDHINSYLKESKEHPGAEILGIHLEGIFITKYGVHNKSLVETELIVKNLEPYVNNKNIIIFTLAPELDKTGEAIKYLHKNKILVSIGHSNASYKEGERAIKEYGIKSVTHMFNGLKGVEGFSHRSEEKTNLNLLIEKLKDANKVNPEDDGIVLSILKSNSVHCMAISDGIHVHPEVLKYLYKIKGPNQFSLVSDLVAKSFFEEAKQKEMLAGGQITIDKCVANLINWNIDTVENCLKSASSSTLNLLKNCRDIDIEYLKTGHLVIWNTEKNTVKGTIIGEDVFLNDET